MAQNQFDDAKIAQLKAEHGDVRIADFPNGAQIAFRRPKRSEYNLWQDARDKEVSRSAAAMQLAQSCIVAPAGFAELVAQLEECPGALLSPDGILDGLVEMAGGLGGAVVLKKPSLPPASTR